MFVFGKWRAYVKKEVMYKKAVSQIQTKLIAKTKKQFLKHWRTSLYLQDMTQQVAIPFFEKTIELSLKRKTFFSLQDYLIRS